VDCKVFHSCHELKHIREGTRVYGGEKFLVYFREMHYNAHVPKLACKLRFVPGKSLPWLVREDPGDVSHGRNLGFGQFYQLGSKVGPGNVTGGQHYVNQSIGRSATRRPAGDLETSPFFAPELIR